MPLDPELGSAGDALILTQNASDLSRLISTENLPRNWAVAIIDGTNRVVVSTAPDEAAIGKPFVTPAILSEMQAFSGNFFSTARAIFTPMRNCRAGSGKPSCGGRLPQVRLRWSIPGGR